MSFEAMANYSAGRQSLESQQELQQIQNVKKILDEIFGMQISQKKIQVQQDKASEQDLKNRAKESKLNAELISKLMVAAPGQPVVGGGAPIQGFEMEEEAQGLPILDNQGISI